MTSPQTLVELLDHLTARRGSAAFLQHRGSTWSADEFGRVCHKLAAEFLARGVRPGDRVVVYLEKCPLKAAAVFAIALVGAISVIANPRLKAQQLRFLLDDAEARLVLTSPDKQMGLGDLPEVFAGCELVMTDALPDLLCEPGAGSDAESLPLPLSADMPATIIYTSGSTGMPKGIVQSHQSLCDGARIVAGYLGLGARDQLLAVLPLSFDYGLNQLLGAAYAGARISLLQYLGIGEVLAAVGAQGISVLAGVPTLWIDFAALLDQGRFELSGLATLRIATSTGGRLPQKVIDAFAAHLPRVSFFSMYGLTEAFRSSYLQPAELANRPGSIGKAIPEVELLVVDPSTGCELGPDRAGELVHCGALVASGYWKRPEDSARVFRPHPVLGAAGGMAVFSGDLVRRDAEGYFYFVARNDQQIKVSGYRISPDELSAVLAEAEGVADVAVLGLDCGDQGQRIAACLVAEAGLEAQIRRHCRAVLPAYMQPAEYHFFDKLPLGPNRKVDIGALRRLIN